MKDTKQLLEEIMDDVNKNQLSRELELDHVENYLIPKAKKNKNKDEKKEQVGALENKAKMLKEEMEARVALKKVLTKRIKNS
jgi:predicted oxidoreductase